MQETTSSSLSFRLENNLGRDAKCSLTDSNGDLVASKVVPCSKRGSVTMSSLSSHSVYSLNCQVFSRKDANDISKVITQTGALTVRTSRSFLATLFRVLVYLTVGCVVLFGAIQVIQLRNQRKNNAMWVCGGGVTRRRLGGYDDPEKQLLLSQKTQTSNAHRPLSMSLCSGSQDESWRCSVCQYLNHGNGDRCSMCNVARNSGSGVDERAEERGEEVEIPQPILKKSSLGVGMKLTKSEVGVERGTDQQKRNPAQIRKSLGSVSTERKPKEDIFSEVGLGIKSGSGRGVRRSMELNKPNKPNATAATAIHMKEPPALQISSDDGDNGWGDDEDLDFCCVCYKEEY